ncbi:hypothetical protein PR202_gb12282 [Eleusine coracana subsp. coracana]|uniref:Uncharacterized protein n=1 Tax=Eleusine coracana subsp. coracana TaxID=191504 RepID=A0AAV5EQ15_ELECO|nr:hypothetical protein PR202_gb12282 [Eleusine coracana subsp. coracana]
MQLLFRHAVELYATHRQPFPAKAGHPPPAAAANVLSSLSAVLTEVEQHPQPSSSLVGFAVTAHLRGQGALCKTDGTLSQFLTSFSLNLHG